MMLLNGHIGDVDDHESKEVRDIYEEEKWMYEES